MDHGRPRRLRQTVHRAHHAHRYTARARRGRVARAQPQHDVPQLVHSQQSPQLSHLQFLHEQHVVQSQPLQSQGLQQVPGSLSLMRDVRGISLAGCCWAGAAVHAVPFCSSATGAAWRTASACGAARHAACGVHATASATRKEVATIM